MNKLIAFSPCDNNNLANFNKLEKSFHHFHPNVELRRIDNPNPEDKDFWYRATPVLAKKLFDEGFDTILKLDADQIITGSLIDIIEDKTDYDVAVVLNDPSFPIQVWDIFPYYNLGLVVLKSKAFVEHWLKLCFSEHFPKYQFREQDLLNILASNYHNYRVKILDQEKVYGEFAKPNWTKTFIKDDKIWFNFNKKIK